MHEGIDSEGFSANQAQFDSDDELDTMMTHLADVVKVPGMIATLTADVPRLPKRDQAVRCGLELAEEGWRATPTGPQGSHVLTSMLGADALALIPPGEGDAAAGERVEVELL